MAEKPLIPNYGDYENLYAYKKADVIYQMTFYFCETFMDRAYDRTVDQMVQAARSGKQNIAEGCTDFSTSMKTGIHLVNVARGSLKELKEDYLDWLKVHNKRIWEKDSAEVRAMRNLAKAHNDAEYYMCLCYTRPPETIANMAHCLLEQTDYLINKLLQRMSDDFDKNGGFSERMYNRRSGKHGIGDKN